MDSAMQKRLASLALNENGFAFDPATGHTYSVNRTGVQILRLAASGKSLDEILVDVCDRFEIDPKTARHDLDDFLDRLADLGLVGE